ncbi:MAG: tripartite tricarboxylate transporter TctB family protein [Rhodocyclaceae bacterium]|jgi:hypothetical protein
MTEQSSSQCDTAASQGEAEFTPTARSETMEGIGWMLFGIVILIASLRMDRLEAQDINPYTIPGLLPSLLGIVMTILGFLIFIRRWTRFKEAGAPTPAARHGRREGMGRMLAVLGICLVFCIGMLGKGLPYWFSGGIFVTVCIVLLSPYQPGEARFTARKVAKAGVIGFIAGIAIALVFEQIFMIRLP